MHEPTPSLLSSLGFSVFPLGNGGTPQAKKPRVPLWKPYQTEAPDDEQVEAWAAQWPKSNWAIACGLVSNLVVADCDSPQALAWAEDNLRSTPVRVQTRRGWHLYYQHPGKSFLSQLSVLRKRLKDAGRGVDLQIDGFYVVAPGSLHEDGKTVYTLQGDLSTFREYAPEFALADGKGNLADIDCINVGATFNETPEGERHDRMCSHAGKLIKRGLSRDAVLADVRDQNNIQCVPPLPDKEIVSIVDSVFTSEERNHPKEQISNAMDGLRLATVPDAAASAWPDDILHPGGLLELLMDYCQKSAVKTERVFALAGAITLLGTILGQRLRTTSGLTTNVYCIAIGGSGCGKDAPKRMIGKILRQGANGMSAAYGGSDVASDTSILNYLSRENCHRAMFALDEIGQFLKSVKNQNTAKYGVIKFLTEIYSCYDTPYIKRYASSDNDKSIDWQALSIFGASVPEEFWGALCDGEATNGFLARCLIFEAQESRTTPLDEDELVCDIPATVMEGVNALWNIDGGERTPDMLASGGVNPHPMAKPHTIPFDDAAKVFHKAQKAALAERQRQAEQTGDAAAISIYHRCAEIACKLALVCYASKTWRTLPNDIAAGDITPMSVDSLRWGWATTLECANRAIRQIALNIHESDFQALAQRIIRAIERDVASARKKGLDRPGSSRRTIERATKGTPSRDVQLVLDKLMRSDELRIIESWKSDKGGRPTDLYCLVEEVTE